MSEASAPTTPKDGFITFAVIYLLLTLCGSLTISLWMWPPARLFSSMLFGALVALYALFTAPGRRTGWRAFLLCGALMPGVLLILGVITWPLPYELSRLAEGLTAGFGVGFKLAGGYAPFLVTFLLWVGGIVLAAVAGPVLRQIWHFTAAKK